MLHTPREQGGTISSARFNGVGSGIKRKNNKRADRENAWVKEWNRRWRKKKEK